MALLSSIKSAYQSATKKLQSFGASAAKSLIGATNQQAAVATAIPATPNKSVAPAYSGPTGTTTLTPNATSVVTKAPVYISPQGQQFAAPLTPTKPISTGYSGSSAITPTSLVSPGVANVPAGTPTTISYSQGSNGAYTGGQGATQLVGSGGGAAGSAISTGLAVPSYGQQVTDSMGRVGKALFDPNTGKALVNPADQQTDPSAIDSLAKLYRQYFPEKESVLKNPDYIAAQTAYDQARARANNLSAQIQNITDTANVKAAAATGRGEGIPLAVIGGQQAEIYKEAAIQALPLQSQLAYAQGDVQTAQENLTRLSSVLTEEANNKYDYQKALASAVIGYATDVQKAQIQSLIDQKKTFATEQAKTYAMLAQNNAPSTVWEAARSAKDLQQLYQAVGQYGIEQKLQYVSGTATQRAGVFNQATGQFAPFATGSTNTNNAPAGLTPTQQADPFIQKLLATEGGKPITDTFAQSLNKGLTVLSQLGVLEQNIKDTNTGPIVGAFRGVNPWDTNAQTIKAQLNAIVPNLARGVYGEVGVLTDNDIKTYSQTLPNLKSTSDVRNAVLAITIDQVSKSIKRTLEVNAANGKDVSGFVDLYTEMQNTRDAIFAQIPGYKGPGDVQVTPEDTALFNSVVTSTSPSGGFFSDVWKAITGQ